MAAHSTSKQVVPSKTILRIAEEASSTSKAKGVMTMLLAPDQILATLSIEFPDDLRAPETEGGVITIERNVRAALPEAGPFS
jgi:hypothetical protein